MRLSTFTTAGGSAVAHAVRTRASAVIRGANRRMIVTSAHDVGDPGDRRRGIDRHGLGAALPPLADTLGGPRDRAGAERRPELDHAVDHGEQALAVGGDL